MALLAFLLLSATNQATAQVVRVWEGQSSPNPYFELKDNWEGSTTPDVDDVAQFDRGFSSGTSYDVRFQDSPAAIHQIGSLLTTDRSVNFYHSPGATTQFALRLNGAVGFNGLEVGRDAGIATSFAGIELTVDSDVYVNQRASLIFDGSHTAGSRLVITEGHDLDVIGGNFRLINGATALTRDTIVDSDDAGTVAEAQITGSQWANDGDLRVGILHHGLVRIESGSTASTNQTFIGSNGSNSGRVRVEGTGSQWDNELGTYLGADNGIAEISVTGGAIATTQFLEVADGENEFAGAWMTVQGVGSRYEVETNALFGERGGEASLSVFDGGVFQSDVTVFGGLRGIGTATVHGSGSQLRSTSSLTIGNFVLPGEEDVADSEGTLSVSSGGFVSSALVAVGSGNAGVGNVTVSGDESELSAETLIVGKRGSGDVTAELAGIVSSGDAILGELDSGIGIMSLRDDKTVWSNAGGIVVGKEGSGQLNVENEARVSSTDFAVGGVAGGTGDVLIRDFGSRLTVFNSLVVGDSGDGFLLLEKGGRAEGLAAAIGTSVGGNGAIVVTGSPSLLEFESLAVGELGTGNLRIESEGTLHTINSTLGSASGSSGSVTVNGLNSLWQNDNDLDIGQVGNAILNVEDDAIVAVGGRTRIGNNGQVNMLGGNFEFGVSTLGEFANLNAVSGRLAGSLDNAAYFNVANLPGLGPSDVDMSDVQLKNTGTLYGTGVLNNFNILNADDGEIQTFEGEQVRYAGSVENFGEVNNFDGLIRFEGNITNQAGGFIGGQGTFIANGGLINAGVIAITGNSNILGDVEIQTAGQLVTSGFATTTLFDDLVHNGAEIRTSNGSALVVLGGATGAGDYTGTGTVFFEGDLRPGNSPDIVSFEGDVVLGSFADTFIELGGVSLGLFDQLDIDGRFEVSGDLFVNLIDGFELQANQQFLIADVEGLLAGQFNGLSEGGLVGSFGGQNLYITYNGIGGNGGIGLFTPVPEPGSTVFLMSVLATAMLRRKRSA